MADLVRESILHTLVAALVYAALVRAWRVDDPDDRITLALVSLAVAVLALPVLALAAPLRTGADFRDDRALFDSTRWNDIRVLGAGAADIGLGLMLAAGVLLFLRDLVPWVRERAGRRHGPVQLDAESSTRIRAVLDDVADQMGLVRPPVLLLDDEAPVLLCAGWRRPALVVSRGAHDRLDDDELRAAIAHELAHVERRDTVLGWTLMAVRAICWFNPVVQVLARDLVQELERRADERAAAVTGDRLALAASVLKVFVAGEGSHRTSMPWPVPVLDTPARVVDRFAAAAVEARCRRLLAARPKAGPRRLARLRAGLAAAGLTGLLYFVV